MVDFFEMEKKLNILLIEDDLHIRQGLEMFLIRLGYNVTSFDNIKDPKDLILNDEVPDIIVSDNQVIGGYGSDFLAWLRSDDSVPKQAKNIPFILMSGSDLRERCKGFDKCSFLQKPFVFGKLKEVIEEFFPDSQ